MAKMTLNPDTISTLNGTTTISGTGYKLNQFKPLNIPIGVEKMVGNLHFYKIDHLVVVYGWYVLNTSSATFTVPYKPINKTWVPITGCFNNMDAAGYGVLTIGTNGSATMKFNTAVTYGTASFCYFTND